MICCASDDMSKLEASCGLMPAEDNPYSAHALPLQTAQQMEREERLRAASLAYEAAARVTPSVSPPCHQDVPIFLLLCRSAAVWIGISKGKLSRSIHSFEKASCRAHCLQDYDCC